MIHKELILILIQIEITKLIKEKTRYPLTVTQKINNKSTLTVYNYTKNKFLNKYESTLNIIKQIKQIKQITKLIKFSITRKLN